MESLRKSCTVHYDDTPLQNQDAFRWFNPLLEQGGIELEAAGSLKSGQDDAILSIAKHLP